MVENKKLATQCRRRAEEARRMAEAARTDAEKADLLEVERRWLKLARNHAAKIERASRKKSRP
jgi:hypothetical protein